MSNHFVSEGNFTFWALKVVGALRGPFFETLQAYPFKASIRWIFLLYKVVFLLFNLPFKTVFLASK